MSPFVARPISNGPNHCTYPRGLTSKGAAASRKCKPKCCSSSMLLGCARTQPARFHPSVVDDGLRSPLPARQLGLSKLPGCTSAIAANSQCLCSMNSSCMVCGQHGASTVPTVYQPTCQHRTCTVPAQTASSAIAASVLKPSSHVPSIVPVLSRMVLLLFAHCPVQIVARLRDEPQRLWVTPRCWCGFLCLCLPGWVAHDLEHWAISAQRVRLDLQVAVSSV